MTLQANTERQFTDRGSVIQQEQSKNYIMQELLRLQQFEDEMDERSVEVFAKTKEQLLLQVDDTLIPNQALFTASVIEKIDALNQLVQAMPNCSVGELDLLDGEKIAADLVKISMKRNFEIAVQDFLNQDNLLSTPKFSEKRDFNSTFSAGVRPNKFVNATLDKNTKVHKLKIRVQPMKSKAGESNSCQGPSIQEGQEMLLLQDVNEEVEVIV